jgi:hypothetical protein
MQTYIPCSPNAGARTAAHVRVSTAPRVALNVLIRLTSAVATPALIAALLLDAIVAMINGMVGSQALHALAHPTPACQKTLVESHPGLERIGPRLMMESQIVAGAELATVPKSLPSRLPSADEGTLMTGSDRRAMVEAVERHECLVDLVGTEPSIAMTVLWRRVTR